MFTAKIHFSEIKNVHAMYFSEFSEKSGGFSAFQIFYVLQMTIKCMSPVVLIELINLREKSGMK